MAKASCACGNPLDQRETLCARCSALQTLSLGPAANSGQIEDAHRTLSRIWDPAKFEGDSDRTQAAAKEIEKINLAHAYLVSTEPKRIARRTAEASRRKTASDSAIATNTLMRILILALALGILGIALVGIDAYLSTTNSKTAGIYRSYRDTAAVRAASEWELIKGNLHSLAPASKTSSSTTSTPAGQSDPTPQPRAATTPSTVLPAPPRVPMPYVTVGLTRDEVIAAMGTPTSSSADLVAYKGSVFYLRNGAVVGWKVDPALIPLRVKLWPKGHPDPRIKSFTVGSSKNEVIAVQGTPTLLSENKFGYGASAVFFENGRVTGWMNDRTSEQLRAANH